MRSLLIEGQVILDALQASSQNDFDLLWRVLQSAEVEGYISQVDLDHLFIETAQSQGVEVASSLIHHLGHVLTVFAADEAPMVDVLISKQADPFLTSADQLPALSTSAYLERLTLDMVYQNQLSSSKNHKILTQWLRKFSDSGLDPFLAIPLALTLMLHGIGLFDKLIGLEEENEDELQFAVIPPDTRATASNSQHNPFESASQTLMDASLPEHAVDSSQSQDSNSSSLKSARSPQEQPFLLTLDSQESLLQAASNVLDLPQGSGFNSVQRDTDFPLVSYLADGDSVLVSQSLELASTHQLSLASGPLGEDRLTGDRSYNAIQGSVESDTLRGGKGNDRIDGNKGDDLLRGGPGNDELIGGDGDDVLQGGFDDDTLKGLADDDLLDGGHGNDVLEGGYGDDTIKGGHGNDVLRGDRGNDVIISGGGFNLVFGGQGSDTIIFSQYREGVTASLTGKVAVLSSSFAGMHTDSRIDNLGLKDADGTYISSDENVSQKGDAVVAVDSFNIADTEPNIEIESNVNLISPSSFSATNHSSFTEADTSDTIIDENNIIIETGEIFNFLDGIENLIGTKADDRLTGDGKENIIKGFGGTDTLTGGESSDTFVVGDTTGVFHNEVGHDDLAIVADFESDLDIIRLAGEESDYTYFNIGAGLSNAIALDNGDGKFDIKSDELIAIVNHGFKLSDLQFV